MDDVWRDDDTTPGRIEAALRNMFAQRHKEERAYVPARVMNMVVIVDKDFRGEIDNRLRRVGRFHPSRLIVVAVEPGRRRLAATVRIGTEDAPQSGSIAVGRERVELQVGERHLAKLDTIVDPLDGRGPGHDGVVPARARQGIDALRRLAQIVLIDSQDEPDVEAALTRADDLSGDTYVVDLAWLRSTPWRERVAAAFDSPRRRPDLKKISGVTVRHREDSLASGLLFCGWLASRLGVGARRAVAGARALQRPRAHAPAGHQADTAAGRHELARSRGGDDRARLRAGGRARSRARRTARDAA